MRPIEMQIASINLHPRDGTLIEITHQVADNGREYAQVEIGLPYVEKAFVTLFPTVEWMRRAHAAFGAYLAEHDATPDGSTDRADIIPAEAATWEPDPIVGRRNAPRSSEW